MKRRTYLVTASAATAGAFAGCTGGNSGSGDNRDGQNDGTGGEHSALVGTYDDFEDLDAWEAVVGTVEADAEDAYEGSQSAHLYSSDAENQARISRTLSEPIDVGAVHPGAALTTDSVADPVIQLHDENGDYLEFHQHVRAEQPFHRHNFGLTNVSGDPDRSAITEIQVVHWTGDDREGHLWIDDLHFVPRVDTGRVMVQFQGGFETDYTVAYPILEEHGLAGATFVTTDRIRESEEAEDDRLTEDQLAELVDAGWSVGTVGARHAPMDQIDSENVESHILGPLDWFEEHGYDDARYFAFPGGRYGPEAYDLVAENYDLGFAGLFESQGWASNEYTITRISGREDEQNLGSEDVIDALDWTAEHGGITTIVFYEMGDGDGDTLDDLAAHLAELQSSGDLETITPREIADEYVP